MYISLIFWFAIFANLKAYGIPFMTRDECKHTGMEYVDHPIINEFISSKFATSDDLFKNDLALHHGIISSFCKFRKKKLKKLCSWHEYYLVLDHVRQPFSHLYDPGMSPPIHLSSIQSKGSSGSNHQSKCDVITQPSAKIVHEHVISNKPVIFKGAAKDWPAVSRWNSTYLQNVLQNKQVVVSVTPSGDFDGPELAELWDPKLPEPYVIARPAHWSAEFGDFIRKLKYNQTVSQTGKKSQSTSRKGTLPNKTSEFESDASFYLEYFPLAVLGDELYSDIPKFKWANFLIKRTNLLWMGGGGHKTVGRLHFDRNENLMAMIRGSKTFYLYDPGQSGNLYGDIPIRSASYGFSFTNDSKNAGKVVFYRDSTSLSKDAVDVHTYSPVDIHNPDYKRHPLFRKAKGFSCTIETGDILFLPSHWWHEVVSTDDADGLSIGVNYFFEPYYHRPQFKCVPPLMQFNRYYSHIRELKTAVVCGKEEICFAKDHKVKKRKLEDNRKKSRKAVGDKKKKKQKAKNLITKTAQRKTDKYKRHSLHTDL